MPYKTEVVIVSIAYVVAHGSIDGETEYYIASSGGYVKSLRMARQFSSLDVALDNCSLSAQYVYEVTNTQAGQVKLGKLYYQEKVYHDEQLA